MFIPHKIFAEYLLIVIAIFSHGGRDAKFEVILNRAYMPGSTYAVAQDGEQYSIYEHTASGTVEFAKLRHVSDGKAHFVWQVTGKEPVDIPLTGYFPEVESLTGINPYTSIQLLGADQQKLSVYRGTDSLFIYDPVARLCCGTKM
jgi:hypothetical protein